MALLIFQALLIQCAHVRLVKKRPGRGGVIAVENGLFETYDEKAEGAMSRACRGKGYTVVEEGETVVGTKTQGAKASKKGKSILWSRLEKNSSETRNVTEWRIKFKCGRRRS